MRSQLKKFTRCESGASTTIEAVIWLPLYLFILTAAVDLTVMMKAQTDMWAVASNSARMVAINAMSEAQAENYARSLLTDGETVTVSVVTNGPNVTSTVVRETGDVARFGLLQWTTPNISASTTQRIEPTL